MASSFTMQDLTRMLIEGGFIRTKKVSDAFLRFDRKDFVREEDQRWAYEDTPLQIGNDSTISQPSTVAMMLELLHLEEGDNVLEIGTGSGWEACIISYCIGKGKLTTIEIDPDIMEFGKANIKKYGIKNIKSILGDGSKGYAQNGPYNKIIFSVAAPTIRKDVLAQLKNGGRLIAPIGTGHLQTMKLIEKTKTGFTETNHGWFSFSELNENIA